MNFSAFSSSVAQKLPPEMAHRMAIMALKAGAFKNDNLELHVNLKTAICGLTFTNPVGMAAGFDKDAEVIVPLLEAGFGFVEAGTVTPKPQLGNPKPRVFRLPEDRALINRLGFNSKGIDEFLHNLKQHRPSSGVVGINIGKNKETENALEDYRTLLTRVYGKSDYITVNISSPNTPGLRDLQRRAALEELLGVLMQVRNLLAEKWDRRVPLFVKIAPDLSEQEKEDIAGVVMEKQVDALIVSNTTVSRPTGLQGYGKEESGGLSGKPLFALSTTVLQDMYRLTKGGIPLIGVGGITSGFDAYTKIRAGASLVQLYTALVYEGFGLVARINEELAQLLEQDGVKRLENAVGVDVS